MGDTTTIEWADKTFNPWIGCTKVSAACDNCYAEAFDKRYEGGKHWGPKAPRRRTSESNWKKPLQWNRAAEKAGIRYRVFCASLADVFDNKAPPEWRNDLWALIHMTPHLDWLLLTKRPQNIPKMMGAWDRFPDNVWLGTTVENQDEANRRIPHLCSVEAAVRFLSCEPLLGPIDLSEPAKYGATIDWIIVGGESGPNARPMHPLWVDAIRQQCQNFKIPFLFKQWGEWEPVLYRGENGKRLLKLSTDKHETILDNGDGVKVNMRRMGKKKAGRSLGGATWDEFPSAKKSPPDSGGA